MADSSIIKVTLPDGTVLELPLGSTGLDVAAAIGPGLKSQHFSAPWRYALLGGVFATYFVLMFYEHFLDHHTTNKTWSPRMTLLMKIMLVILALFLLLLVIAPGWLHIPYFYLWFGLLLILAPIIIELLRRPKLSSKLRMAKPR